MIEPHYHPEHASESQLFDLAGAQFRPAGETNRIPLRTTAMHGAPLSYSDRTADLFPKVVERAASPLERAEFAGLLVFPSHARGAQLYTKDILVGLEREEGIELESIFLFPDTEEYATRGGLLWRAHRLGDTLSRDEWADLLGALSYPWSEASGTAYASRLRTHASLVSQSASDGQICRAVVSLAREVIDQGAWYPCSTNQLSALTGVDPRVIGDALEDPIDGLAVHELASWRRQSRIGESVLQNPGRGAVQRAASAFVTLENHLYKAGIVSRLTPSAEISRLFVETPRSVDMRFLPEDEHHFRGHYFADHGLSTDANPYRETRVGMVYSVVSEISLHRAGEIRTLRSDTRLAEIEGVRPVTVAKWLAQELTTEDLRYREEMLSRSAPAEEYLRSPSAYRRDELKALRSGEITRLMTEAELAARFSKGVPEIRRLTTETMTPEETLEIDLTLAYQPEVSRPRAALERIWIDGVVRRLDSAHMKMLRSQRSDRAEGAKGRVDFMGLQFDSYEEAAFAFILKAYLKNYDLEPGVTLHVANNGKIHDFVIDGIYGGERRQIVLEYHRPQMYYSAAKGGDFPSYEEYQEYLEYRNQLQGSHRERYEKEVALKIGEVYHERRKKLMEENPKFTGYEMRTVLDPLEGYYELRSLGCDLPEKDAFLEQFFKLVARIRQVNRKT
jgi:hypothetical protein